MDYLQSISKSAPIHNAIQLLQQSPATHKLQDFYKRSSRNELVFIGAATFLTLYNLKSYVNAKRQRLNLPPTVGYSLPIVGHSLYLMFSPHKFIDWCNSKYGEIYNLHVLGKTVTITNNKCGEEAYKAEHEELSLNEATTKDLLHIDYFFDEKVMLLTQVDAAVVKATLSNNKVPDLIPSIQKGLERALHDLFNPDGPTTAQQPMVFLQDFVAYMSVGTLVGEEVAANREVIKSFATFTGDIINNVGTFMLVPNFLHKYVAPFLKINQKHHAVVEKYVMPIIAARREKERLAKEAGQDYQSGQDLLQSLIDYKHVDKDGNAVTFSDKELSHNVLMLAFAAVHTTSSNLSYCIYWSIARPDLKAKLMEEINRVSPGKGPATKEELENMPYLNNYIRESLRQSIDRIGHSKKAVKDYTFYNGYQVPKGRTVQINARQLNFGDNMNRVSVEDMNPDMSKNKPSSTPSKDFLTFGMGKHLCPGRFFAVQEIAMSFVYLMKNYDINTVSGSKPHPVGSIAGGIHVSNCNEPLVFTPK